MGESPLIVSIINEKNFGTGFFLNNNTIITCNHCIKGLENNVKIIFNGKEYLFEIQKQSEKLDLALLKSNIDFNIIAPKFSNLLKNGSIIIVYGFNEDLGKKKNLDYGIALEQKGVIKDSNVEHGIITFEDSEIIDGYSGSPLCNSETNEVLGIVDSSEHKKGAKSTAISARIIYEFCKSLGVELIFQESQIEILNKELVTHLNERINYYQDNLFESEIIGLDKRRLNFKELVHFIKTNKLNILTGIGGIGKSIILRRLALEIINSNPAFSFSLFCHCKDWNSTEEYSRNFCASNVIRAKLTHFLSGFKKSTFITAEIIDKVFTNPEVEKFLFVDGFNEISDSENRKKIFYFLQQIMQEYNFKICVSTRNIQLEVESEWRQFETKGIDLLFLKSLVLKKFNKREEDYSTKNFEFLKIPFFLDKCIIADNDEIKSYSEFINKHTFKGFSYKKKSEIQDFLKEEAYKAYNSGQKFVIQHTPENIKKIKNLKLEDNVLFISSGSGYKLEHHLINEYFVAQYLADKQYLWNEDIFHLITFENKISFQVIQMILEQIKSEEEGDEFLTKVYDWNFSAVLHCFKYVDDKYSKYFARLLILILSEKLFDNFKHTKEKIYKNLIPQPDQSLFKKFSIFFEEETIELLKKSNEKIIKDKIFKSIIENNKIHFKDSKYKAHFELFSKLGIRLTEELILKIIDKNPLMGWCAANVIKRYSFTENNELQLRTLYNCTENKIIKWRIVHALGNAETKKSIDFLLNSIESNTYNWAVYGAMRSLIEISIFSKKDFQEYIYENLIKRLNSKYFESFIIKELGYCLANEVPEEKRKKIKSLFEKIIKSENANFKISDNFWTDSFKKFKDYNGIK